MKSIYVFALLLFSVAANAEYCNDKATVAAANATTMSLRKFKQAFKKSIKELETNGPSTKAVYEFASENNKQTIQVVAKRQKQPNGKFTCHAYVEKLSLSGEAQ